MHFVYWMACWAANCAPARCLCLRTTYSAHCSPNSTRPTHCCDRIDAVFSFHSSPVKFINRCLGWHDFIIHIVRRCLWPFINITFAHMNFFPIPHRLSTNFFVFSRFSFYFASCLATFDFVLRAKLVNYGSGSRQTLLQRTQPAINAIWTQWPSQDGEFYAYIPISNRNTIEWHIESATTVMWCRFCYCIPLPPKFMLLAAAHELS